MKAQMSILLKITVKFIMTVAQKQAQNIHSVLKIIKYSNNSMAGNTTSPINNTQK